MGEVYEVGRIRRERLPRRLTNQMRQRPPPRHKHDPPPPPEQLHLGGVMAVADHCWPINVGHIACGIDDPNC